MPYLAPTAVAVRLLLSHCDESLTACGQQVHPGCRSRDERSFVHPDCGPILVVDDDPTFRELVSTLLDRVGPRIVEAASGEEALEAARSERPSLVLLDVDVPGVSGYEVCRELREAYGHDLPIVFVSGMRTERLDRVGGLLLGADDYVVKPFAADELLARVRRNLARTQGPRTAPEPAVSGLTRRAAEILGLLPGRPDQRPCAGN